MAAASLDANFKEELSAIEQWFRVLSEAERTAALYSLLQSATPLQMRFFITILQQMARQDPVSAALLSPANPSQLSFESQMEAKLASFGLKSPASPVVRQFARQSLAASGAAAPPSPAALDLLAPPDASAGAGTTSSAAAANSPAASTLASQRAKLKASARTSAPANLLLSASGGSASLGESLKSPLWAKDETVRERSPSPRPKSTGSAHDGGNSPAPAPASTAARAYLRSPVLDGSFDNQLSPLVGGNWASMVNTPLVPMFGKGDQMEQGNYGVASPNLDAAQAGWNGAPTSPNPNGIVLDDARKFRRSARISGGALGGMYDEASAAGGVAAASSALSASTASDRAQSAATAQKRVQDQLHAVQQLKNMQQSAINLGLGALGSSTNGGNGGPPASPGLGGVNGSRLSSTGALSSPGLQQTAMQAQQNWRNANAAHLPPPSPQQQHQKGQHAHHGHLGQQHQQHQHSLQHLQQQQDMYGMHGGLGGLGAGLAGLGVVGGGGGSPSPQQIQAQTQAQLASLVALQQQMIQQQQQLQSLASLNGLGIPNAGLGVGMGGLLGPQVSPRLGTNGGVGNSPGVGGGFGLGFGGGMPSPRRSPRPHGNDRSPHFGSYGHSSRPGGGSSSAGAGGVGGGAAGGGANPQQTPGSGANPDEPLDMALLGDTPAWLRSLRLHKYTGIFEGSTWQEMAVMGDKDLEDKGVGALGARRKLLKCVSPRPSLALALPQARTDSLSLRAQGVRDGARQDGPRSRRRHVVERLGLFAGRGRQQLTLVAQLARIRLAPRHAQHGRALACARRRRRGARLSARTLFLPHLLPHSPSFPSSSYRTPPSRPLANLVLVLLSFCPGRARAAFVAPPSPASSSPSCARFSLVIFLSSAGLVTSPIPRTGFVQGRLSLSISVSESESCCPLEVKARCRPSFSHSSRGTSRPGSGAGSGERPIVEYSSR